jgi:hypothetical protein
VKLKLKEKNPLVVLFGPPVTVCSSFTINVSKLLSTQHICQITRGTARETTGDLAPAGPPDHGPRAQLDAGTRPYHRAGQEAGPLA